MPYGAAVSAVSVFVAFPATFLEVTVVRWANLPNVTIVWREPDRLPAAYIRV